MYVGSVKVGRS